MVESLQTGRWRDQVGSRTKNTTCPRHLSHCTWLLIIFFCYLLQSHLLVEGTLLCFSKFVKNPLFTILFKQFPGTICTRKVNCVLTCLHEQGQTFAKKIKKLLVFSFLNEQKYYPIPTNKNKQTNKQTKTSSSIFPQMLRNFSLHIFDEIKELQLLVTPANNSGHKVFLGTHLTWAT